VIISGVSLEDLEAARELASQDLGNEIVFTELESYSPARHRVRIKVSDIDGPGARRHSLGYFYGFSKAPRRSRRACAHAYGLLFVQVYCRDPKARIQTAQITYRSAADFVARYPDVLCRNVGSMVCPLAYCDECTCTTDYIGADELEDSRLYIDGVPLVPAMPSPELLGA
jgi:hypothetical protein